jgi:redox-sensitive bicupin YhaK (pirin superfamily)
MYHGDKIPGFPSHPHRGFETITVVEEGAVDHADSLGASGRYGGGDVQWMTAGAGIQHSEMFPLIHENDDNPLELFQIWLNLPKANKFADPYYQMLWNEKIPRIKLIDERGRNILIKNIAGKIEDQNALAPAPDSWAAYHSNDVAILIIKMEAEAEWSLPAVGSINRSLYFFEGSELKISGKNVHVKHAIHLSGESEIKIVNGDKESRMLFLQGKPINEEVVHYGPFVMNSMAQIQQTFSDYQKTKFGGWPWPRHDMVHSRETGRFARYADGREEFP